MRQLVLGSKRYEELSDFCAEFASMQDVTLQIVETEDQVIKTVRENPPALIILDEQICADRSSLDLIRQVVTINPMINTAVISSLEETQFHELFEGLGVLMRLGSVPSRQEAQSLWKKVETLGLL